jgi:AbiTii
MRKRDRGLIGEIERGALDERTPIGAVLRKCVILGGRAGSEELRTWATRELQGYGPDDELPDYRVIPTAIKIDFENVRFRVIGQRISPHDLPDVVREHVDETLRLRMGIGEIEALARRPDDGKGLRVSLPGGADIATMMNHAIGDPYQHIQEVYWSVSPISLRGVIDRVRTTLTALVAELVATMPDEQDIPSSAVAAHAVNVAVHGRRSSVTVNAAQASSGGHSSMTAPASGQDTDFSLWKRLRRPGVILVGAAAIAGAIAAFGQWLGWDWFH